MKSVEKQIERLTEVYSVPCPKCEAQWTFNILSPTKWVEVRRCDCEEYRKLIDFRLQEYQLQRDPAD